MYAPELVERETETPVVSYAALQGLRLAADGTVSYDFDGHVHADGLDLTAGVNTTPPADRRVRWLRETTGELVADLSAYVQAGAPETNAAHWRAMSPDQINEAGITLEATNLNTVVRVLSATVQDTLRKSDFLQLPDLRGTRFVNFMAGIVNVNGTPGIDITDGWSSTRTAPGAYRIDFSIPFATSPMVQITPIASAPFFARSGSPTVNDVVVVTNNAAGASTDTAFSFLVIGLG